MTKIINVELRLPSSSIPAVIDEKWLKKQNACAGGRLSFRRAFPKSYAALTEANIDHALRRGLNIEWIFQRDLGGRYAIFNFLRVRGISDAVLYKKIWGITEAEAATALALYQKKLNKRMASSAKPPRVRRYQFIPEKLTITWAKEAGLPESFLSTFKNRHPRGVFLTPDNIRTLYDEGLMEPLAKLNPKLKRAYYDAKLRFSIDARPKTAAYKNLMKNWWIRAIAIPS